MFNELRKIFIKRKLKHELGHPYLLLSDKDLEKLNKGYGVTFYIDDCFLDCDLLSEKLLNSEVDLIESCDKNIVVILKEELR